MIEKKSDYKLECIMCRITGGISKWDDSKGGNRQVITATPNIDDRSQGNAGVRQKKITPYRHLKGGVSDGIN
jgi:hypothetical protein